MLSLHATARMGSFLPGSSIRPSGAQSRLQAKWRSCRGHAQIWRMRGEDLQHGAAQLQAPSCDVQLQHHASAAVLVRHRVGKRSSQSVWQGEQPCPLAGCGDLSRFGHVQHSAMRAGRCACEQLHSCRQNAHLREDRQQHTAAPCRSPCLASPRDICSKSSSTALHAVLHAGERRSSSQTAGDHDQK